MRKTYLSPLTEVEFLRLEQDFAATGKWNDSGKGTSDVNFFLEEDEEFA
ncbi:MAG: hypothetical protein K6A64_04350 [Bacteroidales bacterium]|nr:hypothetical protein [Bacteroidales bacterium]